MACVMDNIDSWIGAPNATALMAAQCCQHKLSRIQVKLNGLPDKYGLECDVG